MSNRWPAAMSSSPFPGPRPFRVDEADIFFGRDALVDQILGRLRDRRLVTVVGPTDGGKTSLVNAGLLAGLSGSPTPWHVAAIEPAPAPRAALASALLASGVFGQAPDDAGRATAFLHATLRRGPRGLIEALRERHTFQRRNLLIVVDSLDDFFGSRPVDHDEATALLQLLVATAEDTELSAHVVLVMSTDALNRGAAIPGMIERLGDSLLLVPPLNRDQLRAAIVGPATVFGRTVEDELVNEISNDLARHPAPLRLLQRTLRRLWDETTTPDAGPGNFALRLADYDRLGGLFLDVAPAREPASAAALAVPAPVTAAPRTPVLATSAPAASVTSTLAPVTLETPLSPASAELPGSEETNSLRGVLLSVLLSALAMFAFAAWQRLRDLDHEAQVSRTEAERQRSLAESEGQHAARAEAKAEAAEQEALRQTRWARARQLMAASVDVGPRDPVQAVLLAAHAVQTLEPNDPPHTQAARELWRALANCSGRALSGDRGQVTLLAFSPDEEWLATVSDDRVLRVWKLNADSPTGKGRTLTEGVGSPSDVAFTADGAQVIVAEAATGRVVWYPLAGDSGEPTRAALVGDPSTIRQLKLSPRDERALVVRHDGSATIWDVASDPPTARDLSATDMSFAAFAADGRYFLTGGQQWLVWDSAEAVPTSRNMDAAIAMLGLAPSLPWGFGATGEWLYVGRKDGRVQLINMARRATTGSSVTLAAHSLPVTAIAMSGGGKWMASAGADGTLRLWNLRSFGDSPPSFAALLMEPAIGESGVWATSLDGRWAAESVASADRWSIRLWSFGGPDAGTPRSIALPESVTAVDDLVVDHAGKFLAVAVTQGPTTSDIAGTAPDKVILVSRLEKLDIDSPWVLMVDEPDWTHWALGGATLAVTTSTGNVRYWKLDEGGTVPAPISLPEATQGVVSLVVSPDGRRLLTLDGSDRLSLWDIHSAQREPSLTRTISTANGIASTQRLLLGNQVLVVAEADGAFRVVRLDVELPETEIRIMPLEPPTLAQLSVDETWLVIGTEAGFAQLRSLDEPSRSTVLMGHRGPLEDARFSPDSRWLVTVGADGARWWDLTAPHPEAASVLVPGGRPVAIMPVAFQRGLVTIDDQGALHFWPNVATSERADSLRPALLQNAARVTGRNLTRTEWDSLLPDQPYEPTFPWLAKPAATK